MKVSFSGRTIVFQRIPPPPRGSPHCSLRRDTFVYVSRCQFHQFPILSSPSPTRFHHGQPSSHVFQQSRAQAVDHRHPSPTPIPQLHRAPFLLRLCPPSVRRALHALNSKAVAACSARCSPSGPRCVQHLLSGPCAALRRCCPVAGWLELRSPLRRKATVGHG